ncbi:MAG: 1-deoxy-D-xylulose-5-phosphate reductoisomerase [Planctomycetes bacterium]|nr:1-deoxy-D-xylulose-5-phosphate reductoisomerase [Planctomycetota bacterium]
MKRIVILGATGSVGSNTLAVIREHPDDFQVVGLIAGRGGERLAKLAGEFPDAAVALGRHADSAAFARLLRKSDRKGVFFAGPEGALEVIKTVDFDICVAAISGTAGLDLTFAAANRKARILLANKEILVSAGRLFMDAAAAGGAEVLPVDSEHAALWQCLKERHRKDLERLIITASGGPFLNWSAKRLARATPEDALKHPVWRMGAKISVDSATLANKALELIEAHHLFGLSFDVMDTLVHPQSAIHAIAEFIDGSLVAHLGICDMRQPIAYMLFHPERRPTRLPRLDLAVLARLDFARPDRTRFPLLDLGIEAGRRGGKHPAFFNAANETAVELFLARRLSFTGIAQAVGKALEKSEGGEFTSMAEVGETHARAKRLVMEFAANA